MASRSSYWPVVTAIAGLFILVVALPSQWKPWAPSFLNPGFHFGLDLAGGTQLDFRISEDEIKAQIADLNAQIAQMEAGGTVTGSTLVDLQNQRTAVLAQQQNLVEAIRTVLERRINSLGVSEAVITPSFVGDEKHLLIDCPGVVDVQKCIETVGKTIQLEFKEQYTEAPAGYEAEVRGKADAVQRQITGGATLATVGQDMGDDLGVAYEDSHLYFREELPKGLENLWDAPANDTVHRREGSITVQQQNAQGQMEDVDIPGIFLVQVVKAKTGTGRVINEASKAFQILARTESGATYRYENEVALDASQPTRIVSTIRGMKQGDLKATGMDDGSAQLLFLRQLITAEEQVDVSHILVAYQGADDAPTGVTRTKEQALARAQSLRQQIEGGASFESLATQSDAASKTNQGKLGLISRGDIVPAFENVAFSNPTGFISQPVETNFGYHIIKVNAAAATPPDKASFDALRITGANALGRANDMIERMQKGQVTETQEGLTLRTLFFSLKPTGWKDTELDGKHFRTANVTLDPTTNLPVVQIVFSAEGGRLFQELTKKNIGKPIAIFVGGELVSAPTVQGEISGGTAVITGSRDVREAQMLAQDLNTGAIPAPIHLSGQRTVEATLGAEALRSSVLAALIGAIIVMLYMILVYRLLGVIASIALVVYALIFLTLLKYPLFFFSSQYIVLTLAGAAGLILSIGMAVDTNVLVFERVKEEMKRGKSLKTAVEIGFEKAWPSIRDSNISTIITCLLLFLIGTSIVRGFAITLGMGVLISMFSGMIVSKWIARRVADSNLANKPALFPKAGESQQAVG